MVRATGDTIAGTEGKRPVAPCISKHTYAIGKRLVLIVIERESNAMAIHLKGNKHVSEFCDHLDQGDRWQTYAMHAQLLVRLSIHPPVANQPHLHCLIHT